VSAAADRASAAAGERSPRWRAVCTTCRQIFGIPDYEAYLAHAATRHPGTRVLSREEYFAQAIERRYGGGGPGRCC
jgi:uncharacterized short protein YbdD (DUF466 family)